MHTVASLDGFHELLTGHALVLVVDKDILNPARKKPVRWSKRKAGV